MGDIAKKKFLIVLSVIVFLIILIIGIFYFNSFKEPGVYREFSKVSLKPGEVFTLKLNVKIGKDQTFYIIEEDVPNDFKIIEEQYSNNKIKIAKLTDAKDTTYTYQIQAPDKAGEYTFEGVYGMDGMEKVALIKGQHLITVE